MKNIFINVLLITLIVGVFSSILFANAQKKIEYKKIEPSIFKEMMDNEEDFFLIDVRTAAEFSVSRIPKSFLLPDYDLFENIEKIIPDKNSVVVLYCRSGSRSKSASKLLINMGYTNVLDLGGIIYWPYELEHD